VTDNHDESFEGLICPRLKAPLVAVSGMQLDASKLLKISRTGFAASDYGKGDGLWFLTPGDGTAYAVADGFPTLMYPEKLVPPGSPESVDLNDPRYAEAYVEMAHYNAVGDQGAAQINAATVDCLMGPFSASAPASSYPDPGSGWIDARHDALSQFDAYAYLTPLEGNRYLQLGGSGSHAVKALLAGASKAMLLTPMLGEARLGRALAEHFGVADRFHAVIAIGEELPFADGSYDAIYSGGCIHHMRTEHVFAEIHRVLAEGGCFSAVDPWKTPLHSVGTRIFGKRERNVFCRPIDLVRLASISDFRQPLVKRHGPLLRYLFIVLEKFGVKLPVGTMMKIGRIDDGLGRMFGLLERFGGSLVVAGKKAGSTSG
jgi:SAM-dependent methyltransferase